MADIEEASGFSAPLRAMGMVPVIPPREDVSWPQTPDSYLQISTDPHKRTLEEPVDKSGESIFSLALDPLLPCLPTPPGSCSPLPWPSV